jgi:hypothetical protein
MGEGQEVICDSDEVLLILQKWIADSATVMFVVLLFDDPSSPFLGVRLRGVIADVDPNLPGFSFSGGNGDTAIDTVVVDLLDWTIGYADQSAFRSPNPITNDLGESFTSNKPGISIGMWTLVS